MFNLLNKHVPLFHGGRAVIQRFVSKQTHYDVLNISEDASVKEIKAAFVKLSKKYHPDTSKGGGQKSNDEFIKVKQAYDVLVDPKRKEVYDKEQKENHWQQQEYYDDLRFRQYQEFYRKQYTDEDGFYEKYYKEFYDGPRSDYSEESYSTSDESMNRKNTCVWKTVRNAVLLVIVIHVGFLSIILSSQIYDIFQTSTCVKQMASILEKDSDKWTEKERQLVDEFNAVYRKQFPEGSIEEDILE